MPYIEKRIRKDGNNTFRANVRLKGYPKQEATFRRISDAKRWAHRVDAQIRDGKYFPEHNSKKRTLNELIERYQRDVIPTKRKSTGDSQQMHLEWWRKKIGVYTLDRIM